MIYTNEHQIEAWRSDLSAHQEAWKPDHDLAMQCYGCEEFVALGLSLLGFLKASYARWQDQVFRGTVPFDANVDDAHRRVFELWVRTAQLIIVDVERLEGECCKSNVPRNFASLFLRCNWPFKIGRHQDFRQTSHSETTS